MLAGVVGWLGGWRWLETGACVGIAVRRDAAGREVAAARMRVPAVARRLAPVISRDLAQARPVQAQGPHGGEACVPGAGRPKPGARPGTARTAHPRVRRARAAASLAGAE